MIYLSGCWKHSIASYFTSGQLGLLCQPKTGYKPERAKVWAADNGCFGKGYVGDDKYLAWLASHEAHVASCLFATAPDVVGDAAATWERSRDILPRIRELGYPAALVAQDGLEDLEVDWDAFDVLFVGGSTEWKLSMAAAELLREAKRRGKGTHVGRVNYAKRMRIFRALDCVDSIDGTRLRGGSDYHLPLLLQAINEQETQGMLL